METTIVEKLIGVTLIVLVFAGLLVYHAMKDRRAARRRATAGVTGDGKAAETPSATTPVR